MPTTHKDSNEDTPQKSRTALLFILIFIAVLIGLLGYIWKSQSERAEYLETTVESLDDALKVAEDAEDKALYEAREAQRRAQAAEEALRLAELEKQKLKAKAEPAQERSISEEDEYMLREQLSAEIVAEVQAEQISVPVPQERALEEETIAPAVGSQIIRIPSYNRKRREFLIWSDRQAVQTRPRASANP